MGKIDAQRGWVNISQCHSAGERQSQRLMDSESTDLTIDILNSQDLKTS